MGGIDDNLRHLDTENFTLSELSRIYMMAEDRIREILDELGKSYRISPKPRPTAEEFRAERQRVADRVRVLGKDLTLNELAERSGLHKLEVRELAREFGIPYLEVKDAMRKRLQEQHTAAYSATELSRLIDSNPAMTQRLLDEMKLPYQSPKEQRPAPFIKPSTTPKERQVRLAKKAGAMRQLAKDKDEMLRSLDTAEMTVETIAEEIDLSVTRTHERLYELKLPYLNPEAAKKKHFANLITADMTLDEIAGKVGSTPEVIGRRLRAEGRPYKTLSAVKREQKDAKKPIDKEHGKSAGTNEGSKKASVSAD